MTSFMVKLHCQALAEKLLIPAFIYFFFKLYPPAWIANPRREAGAAGGCILIRPSALAKAGGIPAIRQEVIDDCSLAARVKHAGGRLWLGASAATCSIRPYGGFSGIGRMISRSAFSQLRHSTYAAAGFDGGNGRHLSASACSCLSGVIASRLRVLGGTAWLLMVDQLFARAAALPSQSLMGVGASAGGRLLYGSDISFRLEILDGSRRRMEGQNPRP